MKIFDLIIVGGGHSGIEASLICAKNNIKTLLITSNFNNIGVLSCNPSIGGIGKSHLIKELNLLGGVMGKLADLSSINFKTLNSSKGEAVKSIRMQIDRDTYKNQSQFLIKNQKNLFIKQEIVNKLIIKNNKILGLKTNIKNIYFSKIIILTTGTFLNGKIHIGLKKFNGGRINETEKSYLSEQLEDFKILKNKLKTGTPPRIDGNYINFNILKKQKSEINPIPYFNINNNLKKILPQKLCFITNTNEKTHNIIKKFLKYSPIYNELLTGTGPRYCPSIEDKIYRFYNKKKHQIFLEPEGIKYREFYPNGISTSLPYFVQKKMINSIKGLEKTYITKPGYTVEYDYFDPKFLKDSLESKIIKNLFLAGQINGTTGYEEAAAQGLIAGINSILKLKNKNNFKINKKFSYIGVMINDLIKNGVTEPYRILTSKCENRINIRNDNLNIRFKNIIKNLNLNKKINIIKKEFIFKKIFLKNYNNKYYNKNIKLIIKENNLKIKNINKDIYIYYKYKGYINSKYINKYKFNIKKNINLKNINYFKIKGLSKENCEILNKKKPKNIKELFLIKNIKKDNIFYIINFFKNYNY